MKNSERIFRLEYLEPIIHQESSEDDDEIKEESAASK